MGGPRPASVGTDVTENVTVPNTTPARPGRYDQPSTAAGTATVE
jgi:hypothetical protein